MLVLDLCTMYIFINSVLKCWAVNNIYVDEIFFSYPERGQGASHVPALGPFAVHRVVFEMPASHGRTENPVGRSSQSPVGYRYTREKSSLMAYAHYSSASHEVESG